MGVRSLQLVLGRKRLPSLDFLKFRKHLTFDGHKCNMYFVESRMYIRLKDSRRLCWSGSPAECEHCRRVVLQK